MPFFFLLDNDWWWFGGGHLWRLTIRKLTTLDIVHYLLEGKHAKLVKIQVIVIFKYFHTVDLRTKALLCPLPRMVREQRIDFLQVLCILLLDQPIGRQRNIRRAAVHLLLIHARLGPYRNIHKTPLIPILVR